MRTEPSGGVNPHQEKCMTYPNRSESYKEVAVDYEKRDFKALGDHPQTHFNRKQATFDNYGLTHPRNRLGVVYYRHPTTKVLIKIETDSGREWVSVDEGKSWSPWRSPV